MSYETLINQTKIWLFGRILDDVSISSAPYRRPPTSEAAGDIANTPPLGGANNFLLNQIKSADAKLARIYAFSYEAGFYDLTRPTIYLVHGNGIDPEGVGFDLNPEQRTYSRMPAETGRSGLASMSGSFTRGMRAWAYDRADFTLRLDLEGGSFDSLLLSAELGENSLAARSAGSVVRSAGSVARAAGSVARAAGSVARARRNNGSDE